MTSLSSIYVKHGIMGNTTLLTFFQIFRKCVFYFQLCETKSGMILYCLKNLAWGLYLSFQEKFGVMGLLMALPYPPSLSEKKKQTRLWGKNIIPRTISRIAISVFLVEVILVLFFAEVRSIFYFMIDSTCSPFLYIKTML